MAILIGSNVLSVPSSTAISAFDGDTFVTKEKQYIRLSGIDAPETGRCGSTEAKKALESLVIGKPLYIKVLYHTGARSNGLVYGKSGLVNAEMLRQGWAIYNDRDNVDLPELAKATKEARENKRGIFSSLCTQTVNAEKPSCDIKGNVLENGDKRYHLPSCASYAATVVQLYNGDTWFCTETDAQKAGFIKSDRCFP